ncbi:MAG: hypothetical protein HGA96_17425 [Desulfobulbaceae bacterium]|nr:hypothetical protein [Desulfobulbaceae bacterium]
MRKISKPIFLIALFVLNIIICHTVSAYELITHNAINTYVALEYQGFILDKYLSDLGIEDGFNAIDGDKPMPAYYWLGKGGEWEDNGFFSGGVLPRYDRHFHDPNKPIDKAGLWGGSGSPIQFMSAVAWSQRPVEGQPGDEDYSWFDVRQYFYQALTGSNEAYRSANFADTFRGVGQLMHLVQDMSVPEHVRDDFHNPSDYEEWALNNIKRKEQVAAYISGTSPQFNVTTLTSSPFPEVAPVPIARLFRVVLGT